ncbi:MAG TPA: hypothetical protein PLQ36_00735 [Candidatus Gracilibacteria bacterium]|nr:hypothetical protein [Candidatus Gracilibacteria bacterium]
MENQEKNFRRKTSISSLSSISNEKSKNNWNTFVKNPEVAHDNLYFLISEIRNDILYCIGEMQIFFSLPPDFHKLIESVDKWLCFYSEKINAVIDSSLNSTTNFSLENCRPIIEETYEAISKLIDLIQLTSFLTKFLSYRYNKEFENNIDLKKNKISHPHRIDEIHQSKNLILEDLDNQIEQIIDCVIKWFRDNINDQTQTIESLFNQKIPSQISPNQNELNEICLNQKITPTALGALSDLMQMRDIEVSDLSNFLSPSTLHGTSFQELAIQDHHIVLARAATTEAYLKTIEDVNQRREKLEKKERILNKEQVPLFVVDYQRNQIQDLNNAAVWELLKIYENINHEIELVDPKIIEDLKEKYPDSKILQEKIKDTIKPLRRHKIQILKENILKNKTDINQLFHRILKSEFDICQLVKEKAKLTPEDNIHLKNYIVIGRINRFKNREFLQIRLLKQIPPIAENPNQGSH